MSEQQKMDQERAAFVEWYGTPKAFEAGDKNGWSGIAWAAWRARSSMPVGVPDALREAVEYLDDNPFNEIGAGSILHRAMRDALAAAQTVKAEQVQCDAAPSLPAAGSAVEEVEVRGLQWLDTGHYRKKPPQFGYNPHDWNPLMTVAQCRRIVSQLTARDAGEVRVPVELLGRAVKVLERTANDTLDGRNMAVELRALLAQRERGGE